MKFVLGKRRGPPRTPRAKTLRQDLHRCTLDGLFYCLMVGLAEMYLAKFAVDLGLGPVAAGLIATVPVLLAAALALSGPKLLKRVGSFPKYIGIVAGLQGLMLAPLAAVAVAAPFVLPRMKEAGLTWVATATVFILVTLYYFGAIATAAPWITIVGAIIPARLRANYNAHRLRLLQAATLAALLAHGLIADGVQRAWNAWPALARTGLDPVLCGFAIAFCIAGACRLASAWHLSKYSEPPDPPSGQAHIHATDFFRRFRHGNDGRFLLYALAGNCALQVAQPYFNPFMLGQIRFSGSIHSFLIAHIGAQAPYSVLLAAVYLGRILVLPLAGRIAQRRGGTPLLWIGGLALPPMALFWLFTADYGLLLLGQIATGAALAIWELGLFLMNYEAIKPSERTAMITYYTLINESSKTSGSLVGGWTLGALGKDQHAYAVVFYISAAMRVLTLLLLARVGGGGRPTEAKATAEAKEQTAGVAG